MNSLDKRKTTPKGALILSSECCIYYTLPVAEFQLMVRSNDDNIVEGFSAHSFVRGDDRTPTASSCHAAKRAGGNRKRSL